MYPIQFTHIQFDSLTIVCCVLVLFRALGVLLYPLARVDSVTIAIRLRVDDDLDDDLKSCLHE